MEILQRYNYYGLNRRSDRTCIEYRVRAGEAELALFREHGDTVRESLLHTLRAGGLEDRALEPLREPLPEEPRAALSFLLAAPALCLQRAAGHRVGFHTCVAEREPGAFGMVFEYESSKVGRRAAVLAFRLLAEVCPGLREPGNTLPPEASFSDSLPGFLETARGLVLPRGAQAIIDAATRLDIPVAKLDRDPYEGVSGDFRVCPNGMLMLGHARHKRVLDGTHCIDRADLARLLTDRIAVNEEIAELGLPSPRRAAPSCLTGSRAVRAVRRIGFPVAVKSTRRGAAGRVALHVRDETALREAVEAVRGSGDGVVVEQCVEGAVTRVLVAGFEVIGAFTSGTSNREGVHRDILDSAVSAARRLDAGILLMTWVSPDIGRPLSESGAVVVDLDIAPSLDDVPGLTAEGMAQAADALVRWLFPPGTPSRIPLVAITGTNGKTTTTWMTCAIARAAGFHAGLASTVGVVIDGDCLVPGDMSGLIGHRRVLESDVADFGALETARGAILHTGFMFDHCDVAICGNVTEDHLGEYGVETVDDMVAVKRRVLERATRAAIINLDNEGCMRMLPLDPGPRLGLVSLRLGADEARGRAQNSDAICIGVEERDGEEVIMIDDGGERTALMPVSAIPATHGGRLRYNVYNALHAALASHVLGLPHDAIRLALRDFRPSGDTLPGRMNVYDMLPFTVIVNFMTSPDAVGQFSGFVANMEVTGRRIILYAAFGRKADDYNRRTMREALPHFDTWYLRDYAELYGRKPHELPELLEAALLEGGVPPSSIHRVEDEPDAVGVVLAAARAGDLVVIMPDHGEAGRIAERLRDAAAAQSAPRPA